MNRDAFVAAFEDVLVGLLLRSYADVLPRLADANDADLGRRMLAQQKKARQLLGQMYDALHPTPAAATGKPATPPATGRK